MNKIALSYRNRLIFRVMNFFDLELYYLEVIKEGITTFLMTV